MANLNRRKFLRSLAALSFAAANHELLSEPGIAPGPDRTLDSRRILVGTNTPDGIFAFHWNPATGTLTPDGVAAVLADSTWLQLSPDRKYLYVASELSQFQGKPTGAVSSFSVVDGKLEPLSAVNSPSPGTCHVGTDHTGRVVLSADYGGGSAGSYLATDGKLSPLVWSEHYRGYAAPDGKPVPGPVADRQEAAHAHFASVSPDNRFAYINDLGADKIHIYKLDPGTAQLTAAGEFKAHPGAGPRTLHFHKSGKVAYCVNELASTITVLAWSQADGGLTQIQEVNLLQEGATGLSRACDTVLTRDGRYAYFANRDQNFLAAFHTDPMTGKLTAFPGNNRSNCGGKIPRNFTLDPTERWMLVANQESGNVSVFARNLKTGELANQGKSIPITKPMCIVFV